jgi:hypothetical protein
MRPHRGTCGGADVEMLSLEHVELAEEFTEEFTA